MRERTNIFFITNLKAVAIMSVVLFHCLCPYTPAWNCLEEFCVGWVIVLARFINALTMPLFFILAGYLFFNGKMNGKYSEINKFLFNKFNRLVVPLFFWSMLVCLLLKRNYLSFFYNSPSHLWFLGTLFLMFCVFFGTCFEKTSKKWDYTIEVVLFLVSCVSLKLPVFLGSFIRAMMDYAYIFFFGIILAKNCFLLKNNNILLVISLFFLFLSCFFYDLGHMNVFLKFFRLTTVVSIFAFASNLFNKEITLFKKIENQGMGIYIIHHILLQFMLTIPLFSELFYKSIVGGVVVTWFVLFVVSFYCSWLIRKTPFYRVLG